MKVVMQFLHHQHVQEWKAVILVLLSGELVGLFETV